MDLGATISATLNHVADIPATLLGAEHEAGQSDGLLQSLFDVAGSVGPPAVAVSPPPDAPAAPGMPEPVVTPPIIDMHDVQHIGDATIALIGQSYADLADHAHPNAMGSLVHGFI
jgi:hypothetical protein